MYVSGAALAASPNESPARVRLNPRPSAAKKATTSQIDTACPSITIAYLPCSQRQFFSMYCLMLLDQYEVVNHNGRIPERDVQRQLLRNTRAKRIFYQTWTLVV
jgi:hypothetical protein